MELLLNLFWLLLAVPAFWVWRQAEYAQPGSRVHSRRCLVLIGCVVLLLFPVISASDDLQAMRPEAEESCSSDAQRHAQACRHSTAPEHARVDAVLPQTASLIPEFAYFGLAVVPPLDVFPSRSTVQPSGRAPPSFLA